MRIGLVSDTHGLLRPEAVEALRGSDRILHAGDVGDPAILDRLRELAPTDAVRGNVDHGPWASELPMTHRVEVAGRVLYLLHIVEDLDLDPAVAGLDAVIFGHSHQPLREVRNGVLYLNPGSAGPRRFRLPVTVARLHLSEAGLDAEIVDLEVG